MSHIRTVISVLLIPICIGFGIIIPEFPFGEIPKYAFIGLGIGLLTNVVFVRILGSRRLNFLLCFEHEFYHYMLALHPEEFQVDSDGRGSVTGFHTFLSSISPYILPLFSLITLSLSEIVEGKYTEYFQFLTGFFYINFLLENLYQIFIIRTRDIFYEGYAILNSVLVILGNLILFGIMACILADIEPSRHVKYGFIQSADVYGDILGFIKNLLLRAGGEK